MTGSRAARPSRGIWAALAALLAACGGSHPSPTSATQDRTLTVVSGDTGLPVAGAAVADAGGMAVTDASGRGSLPVGDGAPLEITASGFFVRSTLFRGDASFPLWPVRPDAGDTFIEELVYNHLVSDGSLSRPVAPVVLVPSAEIRSDAAALAAEEEAAALASAATEDRIPFTVAEAAEPGAVAIQVSVDPADPFLSANPTYGAITRVTFPGNKISSGSTTYRGMREAEALPLVAHETGHVLGLGHPSQPGLMCPATIAQHSDFTPAEAFAVRMMQLRIPGNRPPDDDRGVAAASARRSAAVACSWEP